MATWITHLRVAERFISDYSKEEYKSFLIGNIAPDSGMLNEDKKTYTPPPEISHYRNNKIKKWKNDNLRFYKDYVRNNKNRMQNKEKSFKTGYFYHLFLDDLWRYYIHLPIKIIYQKEFEQDPLFIWEIKKDWYGIDKEYVRDNPNWSTWSIFIESEYDGNYLDFYPKIAISSKIKNVKAFYSQTKNISRPCKYLQKEEMDQFIELASHWVKEGINLLKSDKNTEYESIMDLMEDNFHNFRNDFGNLQTDYITIIGNKTKI